MTRAKIHFVTGKANAELLENNLAPDKLEACMGGRSSWQYNNAFYGSKMEYVPFDLPCSHSHGAPYLQLQELACFQRLLGCSEPIHHSEIPPLS